MNQIYEERLGTDRMLPLIFRMALPAIVAQMVNLLYNIVDRIYIGHIPGIGTPALAGIGVAAQMALPACEIIVANAAPFTPMLKPKMKSGSSMILRKAPIITDHMAIPGRPCVLMKVFKPTDISTNNVPIR